MIASTAVADPALRRFPPRPGAGHWSGQKAVWPVIVVPTAIRPVIPVLAAPEYAVGAAPDDRGAGHDHGGVDGHLRRVRAVAYDDGRGGRRLRVHARAGTRDVRPRRRPQRPQQ
mgnify:CR=1 FL=1